MSLAREHAEWRALVEVSGPFLSVEILCRAFPQGLDKRDEEGALRARLRAAYEEWQEDGAKLPIHQKPGFPVRVRGSFSSLMINASVVGRTSRHSSRLRSPSMAND